MSKPVLVAGNFKANEVRPGDWLSAFRGHLSQKGLLEMAGTVVVCPAYPQLSEWHEAIGSHGIFLGAQDVSSFEPGAHTGEVTAQMLKAVGVTYVLIGHSERREGLGETDAIRTKKVERATTCGFQIIYCVQNEQTFIPKGITIAAYEPPAAIGSGNPDTPENANAVAGAIIATYGVSRVLYGGSVKPDNVSAFVGQPHIGGVLVGGASLKGDVFGQLAHNAFIQA